MTAKNPFQIKFEQIELFKIEISPNNPRKNIDQEALNELAQSIKTHGVIQPIVVVQNQTPGQQKPYTVLCGERRYRAAKIAGLTEIPAIIRRDINTTTHQEEVAIVENIQREELSPLEELAVYNKIFNEHKSTIDEMAQRFGKSTAYVKGRMILYKLSDQFKKLLQESFISLTIAQELCRYSNEVQSAVYDDHYAPECQQSWIGRSSREVLLNLKHGYSKDLRDYHFDKSSCAECSYNSKNCTLFAEDKLSGNCLNVYCLNYKNTCFVVEKAARLVEQHPELPLVRGNGWANANALEILAEKGYEVTQIEYAYSYPTVPLQDEQTPDEEFAQALENYQNKLESIEQGCEEGRYEKVICVYHKDTELAYVVSSKKSAKGQDPVERLEQKDSRNKEIALEKTIADTKQAVEEFDTTRSEFTIVEEQMTYFVMLKSLRTKNFKLFGIDHTEHYYLNEELRWGIVQNLTPQQKDIIRRDYILESFAQAQRGNYTTVMLFEFAKQHIPKTFDEIQQNHKQEYEKRHKRICERIEGIQDSTPKS